MNDQPEADAIAAIEAAGLSVGDTKRPTNGGIPAGNAVKTEPAAGTELDLGTAVTLFVSSGPKQVVVPDVVGLLRGAANTAITDAELSTGEITSVEDAAPRNTVLSQDPAAATELPKGSTVDFTISSGPALTSVPDVNDQPEADAIAAIEAAGLSVGDTKRPTNGGIPAGNAVKTEPAAGTELDLGTAVTLFVSSGPKQVVVPDVVGLLRGAANTAITDAELSTGEITSVEDAAPRNTVLSQDPAAATELPKGSTVDFTISSGPALTSVPDVNDQPEADAIAAIEAAGLSVGDTKRPTNGGIPAGNAVKTEPAAGTELDLGTAVTLFVSSGPKQVVVPDVVGLSEADAIIAITDAELAAGERTEVNDDARLAGTVVSQDPAAGIELNKDSLVSYVVSLGPVVEPFGLGGTLDNPTVGGQLDAVATSVIDIRGLSLSGTPYDGASKGEQKNLLKPRWSLIYDPASIGGQQAALQRMGLLPTGANLQQLLDELYGQDLPIAYVAQRGRQSILSQIDKLNAAQQSSAAREFGRAALNQAYGLPTADAGDHGDGALAALSLEQGDGTSVMLDWSAANVNANNQSKVEAAVVPGKPAIFDSMPILLQREYSLPFLEGRNFVGTLRADGGWASVNQAWGNPPESTEQIMHPKKYPGDRPTTISIDGLAGLLGDGWSEGWQQPMGELRIAVWLANGSSGSQDSPSSVVKLPNANAANGWGGDTLVSLDGPGGSWAVVWQTKWDAADDVGQFTTAAAKVLADLPGAHAALPTDVAGGLSNPALVLMTSDADTLAVVQAALGVGA